MKKNDERTSIIQSVTQIFASYPLVELADGMIYIARHIWKKATPSGLYEVLDYEATLELDDVKGKRATFRKREKVRYLQDNIIAYQDQAWGDGEILLDYRCTPGKAVDFYRPGQKTYVVISLQNVRNQGEQDEFNIEWGMTDCFLRSKELWETSVNHVTRSLRVNILFPKKRPPRSVILIEDTRQKSTQLGVDFMVQLPNGRWQVHWETKRARQHERYVLQWEW